MNLTTTNVTLAAKEDFGIGAEDASYSYSYDDDDVGPAFAVAAVMEAGLQNVTGGNKLRLTRSRAEFNPETWIQFAI